MSTSVKLLILVVITIGAIFWAPGFGAMVFEFYKPGIQTNLGDRDFLNYWIAATLTVKGESQNLYQFESYFPYVRDALGNDASIRNWSYPPHTLLFLWPLGFLSYKSAVLVFFSVGICLHILAANKYIQNFADTRYTSLFWILHIPFAIMMLYILQNGFHFAALALLGLYYLKRSSVIAGFCFAVLTLKPQLGILLPFLMIIASAWRAIFWSVFFTIMLIVLSILFFGLDDWVDYMVHTIPYQASIMHDWSGSFLRMMPSIFASLRVLDLYSYTSLNVHFVISGCLFPFILWAIYREKFELNRIFLTLLGTFILTPYAFIYDMGALVTICAFYAVWAIGHSTREAAFFLFVGLTCVIVFPLGLIGLPLTPLIFVACFFIFAFRERFFSIKEMNAWSQNGGDNVWQK